MTEFFHQSDVFPLLMPVALAEHLQEAVIYPTSPLFPLKHSFPILHLIFFFLFF